MDPQFSLERQKTSSSFWRPLGGRHGSGDVDQSESLKGPLGLNTLFEPSQQAVADLVFVHGLAGGSYSTWTRSGDPSLFWPKEWLPEDPKFEDVRIHSFGYDSNWDKESILNVHDFAKRLLGDIQDCPSIPRGSRTPLILLGHSMGGLVIKRAFIFARQDPKFGDIANRVRAIYFLATPHRGSQLAALLSKILFVSGPRPFVKDLERNSQMTHSINEEFPHHCRDLDLYSFYETQPMNYGTGRGLVVDKDSATMGYHNERTGYLSANHREVCKYSHKRDANYLAVRNALAATIEQLRPAQLPVFSLDFEKALTAKPEMDNEQRRLLEDFLDVSDAPEEDLTEMENRRMPGSCEWILNKDSFEFWRDKSDSQIFWISAKPATGKSVLSGYVVNHLKDLGRDPIFYFFNYGDKLKSNISYCLRSIAWQMASQHPEILQTVLDICAKDDQICKTNYNTIWRKLFLDGIFRVKLDHPQYLVIDALDECKGDTDLAKLLVRATEVSSIRVFVTSRDRFDSRGPIVHGAVKVVSEEISSDDTKSDISLFLAANMHHLPSVNQTARENMVNTILAKSAGCFLWVSLVLHELRGVVMAADIQQVLNDIPSDMDDLFKRILDQMSRLKFGKDLAKAILTWTVCSARPLATQELYHALQLDIKDSIDDDVQKSITSSCGQLVYVDSQSRVHMVHQTARDFLLRPSTKSEFQIDKKEGHKRLAMTCLDYLNGSEMKGPRRRRLSSSNLTRERSAFASYACNSLHEHMPNVSSTDDDFLDGLAKFLGSANVLSWIEYIAQHSDLNRLIQTGKAIRSFLQRRSKHLNPFGDDVKLLDTWATDLGRLVAKFGRKLADHPPSIYHLIPPFCPPESAPRTQFASNMRGISILGLTNAGWDDCLSTIFFRHEELTALTCSYNHFAIGMGSGRVVIYQQTTCQAVREFQHGESVKNLQFGRKGKILAASSQKLVRVWDTELFQELWCADIPQICMSLVLADSDRILLGALKNNHLMIWEVANGNLRESADWTQELEGQRAAKFRRPTAAAFCIEQQQLAVVYRGQDILLWDLERDSLDGTFGRKNSAGQRIAGTIVTALVFSQAPSASLLAASYWDGDLVLYDTHLCKIKCTTIASAQTLASSPDGRTLASGDSAGMIQIFDFETLKLLYRVRSDEAGITDLGFSGDSHRLLDVRASQCSVWDPMVLVRQEADDETSDTVSVSTAPQEIDIGDSTDVVLITALSCPDTGNVFFCGKDDGNVFIYDIRTGRPTQMLCCHDAGVAIVLLLYDEDSHILTSVDSSSRVMSHRLLPTYKEWGVGEVVLDTRVGMAVNQILCNRGHTRLLVSMADQDLMYSFLPGEEPDVKSLTWDERGPSRWGPHSVNQDQLVLIMDHVAYLYGWETFEQLTDPAGIPLEGSILPELSIRSITPCFNSNIIATAFGESHAVRSRSKLLLFNASDISVGSKRAAPVSSYEFLADRVEFLIGTQGSRLLFLHSTGWICSANPDASTQGYARHFFIPSDWYSTNNELLIAVVRSGDIVFVKRHEVAVIRRGLDTREPDIYNHKGGRKPSLTVPSSSF